MKAAKAVAVDGGELLSYREGQNESATMRVVAKCDASGHVAKGGNHYARCVDMADWYMRSFELALQAQGVDSDSWRLTQAALPVIDEDA